jgi:hypothetical protein
MKAHYFQSMLYQGSYVVIPDLRDEVSDYLGCSLQKLNDAVEFIKESRNGGGVSATMTFRSLRLPGGGTLKRNQIL